MVSSEETALATNGNAAVVAMPGKSTICHSMRIVNGGAAPGFYRRGGGQWAYLPANTVLSDDSQRTPFRADSVEIKRVAGGADLGGVFVSAW
jgi:hypothetical protein